MNQKIFAYLLLTIICLGLLASCEQRKPVYFSGEWKSKVGDNKAWATRHYNDNQWSTHSPDTLAVLWFRTTITLPKTTDPHAPLGLMVAMLASSEAYWDGVLIGKNGKVGTNATSETPGFQTKSFLIPKELATEGTHQVALRMSNFHSRKNEIRFYGAFVTDYWQLARTSLIDTALIHIYAGFFLVIALYFWFIFFINNRQTAFFLFGCICFAFFALLVAEYIKFYITYYYHWHFPRLQIILGINMLVGILMPMFFSYQFGYRFNKYIFLTLVPLFVLSTYVPGYDGKSVLVMTCSLLFSLFIVTKAAYQHKKGSIWVFVGLVPMLFFTFWFDVALFIGFGNLVLSILISLTIQMREQRHQHQASLLRSSRLEVELLKKNIQPHFLMNSLTSAIDWIEENPKEGVKLLNALVKEFDILLDISGKQMIPVMQEIDLCRSHLHIMGFRKEIAYTLETNGIDEQGQVPPALLHTAIENGISHNELDKPEILFRIDRVVTDDYEQYTIFNEADASDYDKEATREDGTGFKYIKARLEESYTGKWSLQSHPVANGWETVIKIGK